EKTFRMAGLCQEVLSIMARVWKPLPFVKPKKRPPWRFNSSSSFTPTRIQVETRESIQYPRYISPQHRESRKERTTPRERKFSRRISSRIPLFLTTRES